MLDAARSALRFMQDRRREDLDPGRLRYEMIFTPADTVPHDALNVPRNFVEGTNVRGLFDEPQITDDLGRRER